MSRLFILIFILPLFVSGQTAKFPTKTELTKAYCKAIGDFIKAANKKNAGTFDTLFFIKRKLGQPDDFPDIELPKTIENTQIQYITASSGNKTYQGSKARININLVGWVNKFNAEFIFIVFKNGFEHQYDYTINYKYNTKLKEFELEKLQFKGPPFEK